MFTSERGGPFTTAGFARNGRARGLRSRTVFIDGILCVDAPGKLDSKPVSPAQMLYAKKIAQGKGIVVPDEAKANSAAMSAWINFEPKREAPQARSQDRLQAGGISCISIDGADEEVSENANRMPLPLLPRSQIS